MKFNIDNSKQVRDMVARNQKKAYKAMFKHVDKLETVRRDGVRRDKRMTW